MTTQSAKVTAGTTAAPSAGAAVSVTVGAVPSPSSTGGVAWQAARLRATVGVYVALTKPGIIWLLLVTTVPVMIMAARGWPGLDLIALTLLGGILTAGGANAMNQWYDRDIDAAMERTAQRPIPMGKVSPQAALRWGLFLAAVGGVQLALTVNWLSAVWALAAVAFYVLVYTMWLKRRTVQNIVIGGAAGAIPPLVGWAAVRGNVELAPVLLALVVLLWTPPHFWALALRYKDDYARANVPMLPVVRGEWETKKQIFAYAVLLLIGSALLPIFSDAGAVYLGAAILLGVHFIIQAARLWMGLIAPMVLFFFSIVYLPLLFLAAAVDEIAL